MILLNELEYFSGLFAGNPSYETCDNLLLTNPGAKDHRNIPLNKVKKKTLNTAKRIPHVKENTYDCADIRSNQREKPNEEKSVYQSLVDEEARGHYRPEVNSTYQSLNPDGVIYQPLLRNMVQKVVTYFTNLIRTGQIAVSFFFNRRFGEISLRSNSVWYCYWSAYWILMARRRVLFCTGNFCFF